MYLVQLLLPARSNRGGEHPRTLYDQLASQLTERFGGVTAYTRAPATGLWESDTGEKVRDQVVVYEVMIEEVDRTWWANLRARLEADFAEVCSTQCSALH